MRETLGMLVLLVIFLLIALLFIPFAILSIAGILLIQIAKTYIVLVRAYTAYRDEQVRKWNERF